MELSLLRYLHIKFLYAFDLIINGNPFFKSVEETIIYLSYFLILILETTKKFGLKKSPIVVI